MKALRTRAISKRRQQLAAAVNGALACFDLQLVRRRRFQALLIRDRESSAPTDAQAAEEPVDAIPGDGLSAGGGEPGLQADAQLSEELREALRSDHPRLLDLKQRYAGHPAGARSVWSDDNLARELALPWFRRDNAYLWQSRDYGYWADDGSWIPTATQEFNYVLTAYYIRSVDRLGLLDKLSDDDAFGAHMVAVADGWSVTRDLLDSVLEADFLDRHLDLASLDGVELLDIGAGYGRLAHRLTEAFASISRVLCTDAIPESTFVSEFYLRSRGAESRTEVVPLDEVARRLQTASVVVAMNVHSFPECPMATIAWWLELLAANSIPYLFIVTNHTRLHSTEADGSMLDFEPLLRSLRYQLVALEPKYRLSRRVQQHGIFPAQYHLYRRADRPASAWVARGRLLL